jgi:hypothetical protein
MTTFTRTPGAGRSSGANAARSSGETRRARSRLADPSTLVLSAMTAVVMVVTYAVLDSASDENWMLSALMLWAVGFVTLAVLSGTARRVASVMGTVLHRRGSRLAARAAQWAHGANASPGQAVESVVASEAVESAVTLDPREPALSLARLDARRKGHHFMRHI